MILDAVAEGIHFERRESLATWRCRVLARLPEIWRTTLAQGGPLPGCFAEGSASMACTLRIAVSQGTVARPIPEVVALEALHIPPAIVQGSLVVMVLLTEARLPYQIPQN